MAMMLGSVVLFRLMRAMMLDVMMIGFYPRKLRF
jgi:hypothetical protein